MKIAVFINDYSQILPFYSSGIIEIYSNEDSKWECINQIPFDMSYQRDLADVQLKISMLTSEFEDCNLLIVENIKRLPLALLAEKGIGVWEFNGLFLPELLNHVKTELEKALSKNVKKEIVPTLVGDEKDAEYEINLASILRNDRSQNSMNILVPFLSHTNFHKLTIACEHLPKWFNRAVETLQLVAVVDKTPDGLLVATVTPAIIEDDISYRRQINLPGLSGCSGGC
jgi:Fe-only nitrogenase accessory protein AnfO